MVQICFLFIVRLSLPLHSRCPYRLGFCCIGLLGPKPHSRRCSLGTETHVFIIITIQITIMITIMNLISTLLTSNRTASEHPPWIP